MHESATLDAESTSQTSIDTHADNQVAPVWQLGDAPEDILAALNPSAEDETRGRLAGIDAGLADLVEEARTGKIDLYRFLKQAARLIRLRGQLDERLSRLSGQQSSRPLTPIEEELFDMTRTVRRWRDGRELREECWRRTPPVRLEAVRAQSELEHTVGSYRRGVFVHQRYSQGYLGGLDCQDDEFIRRLESLTKAYAGSSSRLARLDSHSDDWRSTEVAKILDQAGGASGVRAALSPTMASHAAGAARRLDGEIKSVETEVSQSDPESRAGTALRARLDGLVAQAAAFHGQVDAQRQNSADSLILAAITGRRDAVASLAASLSPVDVATSGRLEQVLASEAELMATIGEMIAPPAAPAH